MNLDEVGKEEVQKMVRQKLVGHDEHSSRSRQKVILVEEVKSYINQGFEYLVSLPDGGQLDKLVCAKKIMLDLYRI